MEKTEIILVKVMYVCDNSCEITTCNKNISIIIRPCVPADRGFAKCLHTYDPMFLRVSISIFKFKFIRVDASYKYTHTRFIEKMFNFICTTPYVRYSTSSLFVSMCVCSSYTKPV